MKRLTFLPLALVLFTAGAVQSQAPTGSSMAATLQSLVETNKALLDTQKKTLDVLDQLDQAAQQLKTFGKRG